MHFLHFDSEQTFLNSSNCLSKVCTLELCSLDNKIKLHILTRWFSITYKWYVDMIFLIQKNYHLFKWKMENTKIWCENSDSGKESCAFNLFIPNHSLSKHTNHSTDSCNFRFLLSLLPLVLCISTMFRFREQVSQLGLKMIIQPFLSIPHVTQRFDQSIHPIVTTQIADSYTFPPLPDDTFSTVLVLSSWDGKL